VAAQDVLQLSLLSLIMSSAAPTLCFILFSTSNS
jgi:hypothetical protein